MAKRTNSKQHRADTEHRHGKGRCLRILRELSAYLDGDLSAEVCREIRRHLGACPNCEDFLASLRQTVSLCRHAPAPVLSARERMRMREAILLRARAR